MASTSNVATMRARSALTSILRSLRFLVWIESLTASESRNRERAAGRSGDRSLHSCVIAFRFFCAYAEKYFSITTVIAPSSVDWKVDDVVTATLALIVRVRRQ